MTVQTAKYIVEGVQRYGNTKFHRMRFENNYKVVINKVKAFCEKLSCDYDKVISSDRQQYLIKMRSVMMKKLREEGYSSPVIGKVFNRNHDVVLRSVRNIENEMNANYLLSPELNRLYELIK